MRARRPPLRVISQLLLTVVVLAWAVSARAGALDDFGVQLPRESLPAPDFSLPRLNGGSESLPDLRGKVVILHFWATWCIACRHEMPQLAALWMQHRQDMMVLGVNVDRGNRSGVARFIKEHHVGLPTVLDAAGTVRHRYRIRALPTSYLIGRDGRIVGRIIGERDWSSPAAEKMINDIINQGEVKP